MFDDDSQSLRFTFQYASIKPAGIQGTRAANQGFTFQYASIKPHTKLIHPITSCRFTFQYASIKPYQSYRNEYSMIYLHFNMLLLNQRKLKE